MPEERKKSIISINMEEDELNADWLRAVRLEKLGTPEALAELARMEATPMMVVDQEAALDDPMRYTDPVSGSPVDPATGKLLPDAI